MLTAGHYHTLTVRRISDHGLYLGNEEGDEVLLPNRFVSLSDRIGDRKEVFVYHDSEDRLVATTERPLATVGQAAFLEAVDKTVHGAFLDWGFRPSTCSCRTATSRDASRSARNTSSTSTRTTSPAGPSQRPT